jgi:hypothetical protein
LLFPISFNIGDSPPHISDTSAYRESRTDLCPRLPTLLTMPAGSVL